MVVALVGLGVFIGLLSAALVLVVSTVFKNMKKGEEESVVEESVLTPEEIEEGLENWRDKELLFATGIEAYLNSNYVIVDVEVHGEQFDSIEEALSSGKKIPREVRKLMENVNEEAKALHKASVDERRQYRMLDTQFDGEIYVYKACKIKIDTKSRLDAKKPARIAIEMTKDEHDMVGITKIYVSKDDVSNASNRYEFDMNDDAQCESFEMLIATAKEYEAEMAQIHIVDKRLDKYNKLMAKGRIKFIGNDILIVPPTKEEIEARRAQVTKKPVAAKPALEDVVAAKEMVNEQFVSSQDAIAPVVV